MSKTRKQSSIRAYNMPCRRGCGRQVTVVERLDEPSENEDMPLKGVCDYCKTEVEKTDNINLMFNPFR